MNTHRILATLMLCTILFGCRKDAPVEKDEATANSARPVSPPVGGGAIAGMVTLSGKPPKKIAIDTSMDPACGISSPAPAFTEQYVGDPGKLGNVFIFVKIGPPAAMQAGPISSQPAVLDQKGCQYTPHVIAVMAGGSAEFRNSDLTMHNIHTMPAQVGNESIDISQGPKGAPVVKQFSKPELMIPVRCNNHPWMNAFINVSATPFFAVSDGSGRFSLGHLPAGEYTLAAVHEKLGEKDIQISVPASGTAKADFSFALP